MTYTFHKYHGAGNDFVLTDGRGGMNLTREQIRKLCHRHLGIGADGFMSLENDPEGQFYMRYFNADGEEATMCGNGGRCIALFAHHLGIGGGLKTFNSSDGLHTAEIFAAEGDCGRVRLQLADVEGYDIKPTYLFLDTGSPHYVEFVTNLDDFDVYGRGRQIRYSEPFGSQGGTNVNFVQIRPDGSLGIRTYERGVENETMACGTGATAAAMAANILLNPNKTEWTLHAPGGELRVSFEKSGSRGYTRVFLEGPAQKVFECAIDPDNLIAR